MKEVLVVGNLLRGRVVGLAGISTFKALRVRVAGLTGDSTFTVGLADVSTFAAFVGLLSLSLLPPNGAVGVGFEVMEEEENVG